MINITEFDISTGEVVTTATVYSILAKDGIATFEGTFPINAFYFSNGAVCEYTAQQKRDKAQYAGKWGYQWNNATMSYQDVRDLDGVLSRTRSQRNALLAQSDWTQLPDVPLATKEAWATYRQALRDITDQPDPFNIVWPTPPA